MGSRISKRRTNKDKAVEVQKLEGATNEERNWHNIYLRSLKNHLTEKSLKAGSWEYVIEVISEDRIIEESVDDYLQYVLLQGRCEVVWNDEVDFDHLTVAYLKPGDMFAGGTAHAQNKTTYVIAKKGCVIGKIKLPSSVETQAVQYREVRWRNELEGFACSVQDKEGFKDFNANLLKILKKTNLFGDWSAASIARVLAKLAWGQLCFIPSNVEFYSQQNEPDTIYIFCIGGFEISFEEETMTSISARKNPFVIGEEQVFNLCRFRGKITTNQPSFVLPIAIASLNDVITSSNDEELKSKFESYAEHFRSIDRSKKKFPINCQARLQTEVVLIQMRKLPSLRSVTQQQIFSLLMFGEFQNHEVGDVIRCGSDESCDWVCVLIGIAEAEPAKEAGNIQNKTDFTDGLLNPALVVLITTECVLLRVGGEKARKILGGVK